MFFTYRKKCELCDREHKDNCDFSPDNDRVKISEIGKQLGSRDFILIAHWRSQPQAILGMIEKPIIVNVDQTGGFSMTNQGKVNVYDCLNYFSMEETLSGNDKWYCSKCKDHVTAYKKMEVYKAPDYLIIHLKRFSHQRNVMFGSRKLNDFVNFPVNGLDMS